MSILEEEEEEYETMTSSEPITIGFKIASLILVWKNLQYFSSTLVSGYSSLPNMNFHFNNMEQEEVSSLLYVFV